MCHSRSSSAFEDNLVSFHSSNLPFGYLWPAYCILQCPHQKGLNRSLGKKRPPGCPAQGRCSACQSHSHCLPTDRSFCRIESCGWGWGEVMVEGGLPSAPVPLEKARERGKTGKAKDYSQAMFNQFIRRETKLKLSRRSGEIAFPPSSCPNSSHVSLTPLI